MQDRRSLPSHPIERLALIRLDESLARDRWRHADALGGRLPVEVSGRGVRYADRERVERAASESEATLRRLEVEIRELWWELERYRRPIEGPGEEVG